MSAPVLTLPAPAAELWKRIAPAVREEIGRLAGGESQYAIGGGSILAARWKHRHSYDVDLVVPPDTPLGMLAKANNRASQFESRLRALVHRDRERRTRLRGGGAERLPAHQRTGREGPGRLCADGVRGEPRQLGV